MQRYFSTGVSTLMRLMAAHRSAEPRSAAFERGDITRVDPYLGYLHEDYFKHHVEAPDSRLTDDVVLRRIFAVPPE